MLEIPESHAMSGQIRSALHGKEIQSVVANQSPHGFAWFFGDPAAYPALLTGRRLGEARPVAGQVEIDADGATLLFGDGVNLRLFAPGQKLPAKHQLLLTFDDGSSLVATVQMYGGLYAFLNGQNFNPYYLAALRAPSPLGDAFDAAHFDGLLKSVKPTMSVKAFLVTEQRVPGLGNGVLQDILFLSGLHPARQIGSLSAAKLETLFTTVKQTLMRMAEQGGRDTEKDLHGKDGGYRTLMSRKTHAYPCPACGGPIQRKAYLGGNVYVCPNCQPLS